MQPCNRIYYSNVGIINSITGLHLVGYFYSFVLRCTHPWTLNWHINFLFIGHWQPQRMFRLERLNLDVKSVLAVLWQFRDKYSESILPLWQKKLCSSSQHYLPLDRLLTCDFKTVHPVALLTFWHPNFTFKF